jgi:WD40 repeat protein
MSATYDIKAPARCLATLLAEEDAHTFLVGTCNLRTLNEVRSHRSRRERSTQQTRAIVLPRRSHPPHPLSPRPHPQVKVLRYSEDDEQVSCAATYTHKHEILSLAPSPSDASLLATAYNAVTGFRGAVWKMPELPRGADEDASASAGARGDSAPEPPVRDLQLVAELPETALSSSASSSSSSSSAGGSRLHAVAWAPIEAGSVLAAAYGNGLRECRIREGGGVSSSALSCRDFRGPLAGAGAGVGDEAGFIGGVAWDPHHQGEVAVAVDNAVAIWDLRAGERTRSIDAAVPAGGCVRSLSYNPNRPWYLATGGDDYRVKCWDLRKTAAPVKVLEGHTHW